MNIKLLRLAFHMNTAQAARYLAARPDYPDGVSETTWVRWENGKKELPSDLVAHLENIRNQLSGYLQSGSECNDFCDNLLIHAILAAEVNKFINTKQ